jgi:hypothetical protein
MIIDGIDFDIVLDAEKHALMNTIDVKFERSKFRDEFKFDIRMKLHQITDNTIDAVRNAKDASEALGAGLRLLGDMMALNASATAPATKKVISAIKRTGGVAFIPRGTPIIPLESA